MNIYITEISKLKSNTPELDKILDMLHIAGETAVDRSTIISQYILPFMQSLKDELKVVVEPYYVDTVYRDSYYCYYASKLQKYFRQCVRLSFLKKEFDEGKDLSDVDNIADNYLGFLILRPLHKCIGRNVISPEAKLNDGILICKAKVPTTCYGIKVEAEGFPHSSQDAETMTCAQTTIWSLLEYYGNKYTCYSPTMPTLIEKALEPYMYERLMPSSGLTYNQISVALRQFGFGPRIYSKSTTNKTDFNETLTCYIESGIPLAVAMRDKAGHGHAVVCIGRKNKSRTAMLAGKPTATLKGKNIFYWNQCIEEFIFNDDNKPCYIVGNIENTAAYYGAASSLSKMEISHFIAPLYSKVYMDASTALATSRLLIEKVIKLEDNDVVRTFLTSTRTYREYLITDSGLSDKEVRILLSMHEPKFVWVTEIATYDHFTNGITDTVIVMDATSGKRNVISSVVFILEKGDIHIFNTKDKKLERIKAGFSTEFKTFKGNLK